MNLKEVKTPNKELDKSNMYPVRSQIIKTKPKKSNLSPLLILNVYQESSKQGWQIWIEYKTENKAKIKVPVAIFIMIPNAVSLPTWSQTSQ